MLGRIGDAAKKLHAAFGDDLPPQIPWSDIIGLRVIVDHAYHKIDYGIVWSTLEHDVPALRQAVVAWAQPRDLVHPHFLDAADAPAPVEHNEDDSAADLERTFHRAMVGVYEDAKRDAGYTATRFIQMVSDVGGLDAARRLINGPRRTASLHSGKLGAWTSQSRRWCSGRSSVSCSRSRSSPQRRRGCATTEWAVGSNRRRWKR